jgi:hypothetical protein
MCLVWFCAILPQGWTAKTNYFETVDEPAKPSEAVPSDQKNIPPPGKVSVLLESKLAPATKPSVDRAAPQPGIDADARLLSMGEARYVEEERKKRHSQWDASLPQSDSLDSDTADEAKLAAVSADAQRKENTTALVSHGGDGAKSSEGAASSADPVASASGGGGGGGARLRFKKKFANIVRKHAKTKFQVSNRVRIS